MPILLLFCLLPLLVGAVVEYLACRIPNRHRKLWRWAPPLLSLAGTVAVFVSRYHGWSEDVAKGGRAPIETLLFVPGLPAALLFVGLFLGWRLWKRLWSPRVINEK